MPVRTRSQVQKMKGDVTSPSSSGGATTAKPARGSVKKTRTSLRLRKKKEEMESKQQSEELTPALSQSSSDTFDTVTAFKQSNDELRKYVKEILDSPNAMTKKQPIGPSPRVDRITINQIEDDRQMEFLIPPKTRDDPIEIRERIRATLDLTPDGKPQTLPFDSIPEKSRSVSVSSSVPVYHKETGLWSPNVPSYDKEYADKVSKWLIFLIFSILISIFFGVFQKEILLFFQNQMKPIGEFWGTMVSFIKNMLFETAKNVINNNDDNVNVEDVNDEQEVPSLEEDARVTIPDTN